MTEGLRCTLLTRASTCFPPPITIAFFFFFFFFFQPVGQHASTVIGGQSKEFFQRVAAYYNVPFAFPPDRQCGKHDIPWVRKQMCIALPMFIDSSGGLRSTHGSTLC